MRERRAAAEPASGGESSRPRDEAEPWQSGLSLAVGATLVALLRFVRLGEWSFWIDEVFTLADHRRASAGHLVNDWGYRLVAAAARAFERPESEYALRFLPALVGWVQVPLVWLLFRRPLGGRIAAIAALFLALSPWHLFWSQSARFYTLAGACALLGAAGVLHASRSPRRDARTVVLALGGIALCAAGVTCQPSAVFVLPGLLVAALLVRLRCGPLPRGATLVVGLLLAALGAGALLAWPRLASSFAEYRYHKPQSLPASLLLTVGYYVQPGICAASLIGAAVAWQRRDAAAIAVTGLVVGIGGQALAASFFARVVAQYVFVGLPFVLLLAAWCVEGGGRKERGTMPAWTRFALLTALAAPLASGTALYLTRHAGERPRWREAYEFVAERAVDGDAIIGMAGRVGEAYLAPETADLRLPERVAVLDPYRPSRLAEMARGSRKLWIVVHPLWFDDWQPEAAAGVRAFLAARCRLVREFPLAVGSRDLAVEVWLHDE